MIRAVNMQASNSIDPDCFASLLAYVSLSRKPSVSHIKYTDVHVMKTFC